MYTAFLSAIIFQAVVKKPFVIIKHRFVHLASMLLCIAWQFAVFLVLPLTASVDLKYSTKLCKVIFNHVSSMLYEYLHRL